GCEVREVRRSWSRRGTVCVALGMACALLSVRAAHADWDPIPAEAWTEPAHPDSGGGDAIFLLDQSEYHHESNRFRDEYFGRARVFTREGCAIGTIEIPYRAREWKLSNVRARSVLPNGRVTEFDPTQIVTTVGLRLANYSLLRA